MLSSALRIGHQPTNSKKKHEKRIEAETARQAPAPMQPVVQAEPRPIIWKHVALGTAAVGAQLMALSEVASPFIVGPWARMLATDGGKYLSLSNGHSILGMAPEVALTNVGLMISLLSSGWMFFKKQQRVPMLLNALLWIVLLNVFPLSYGWRIDWPIVAAALVSAVSATVINKRSSDDLATPIE